MGTHSLESLFTVWMPVCQMSLSPCLISTCPGDWRALFRGVCGLKKKTRHEWVVSRHCSITLSTFLFSFKWLLLNWLVAVLCWKACQWSGHPLHKLVKAGQVARVIQSVAAGHIPVYPQISVLIPFLIWLWFETKHPFPIPGYYYMVKWWKFEATGFSCLFWVNCEGL